MEDGKIVWERNFDEVQIVDDAIEESTIIKNIIKCKDEEDAFFTFDVGELIHQHRVMVSKMPRVKPYYAIKCNPHPTVIKAMAALKAGFDCASKHEIQMVLACGVPGERIVFSNTVKPDSHIMLAKTVGVEMLTVDGEPELHKIKNIFPEAKVLIRFRCDAKSSMVSFGDKSGCDAETDGLKLIRIAKDLGLNLYGFNFNVGTQCLEPAVFARGVRIAAGLIEYAKSIGCQNVGLINVGGGFPSTDRLRIDQFADAINEALEDVDPSIEVISEPGRYYVATAFTLATYVIGKKPVDEGDRTRYIYYINDGIFGSFLNSALNMSVPLPVALNKFKLGTIIEFAKYASLFSPAKKNHSLPQFWDPLQSPEIVLSVIVFFPNSTWVTGCCGQIWEPTAWPDGESRKRMTFLLYMPSLGGKYGKRILFSVKGYSGKSNDCEKIRSTCDKGFIKNAEFGYCGERFKFRDLE